MNWTGTTNDLWYSQSVAHVQRQPRRSLTTRRLRSGPAPPIRPWGLGDDCLRLLSRGEVPSGENDDINDALEKSGKIMHGYNAN